jgi:GNAT superfamily N-acetyltransferase
MPDLLFRRARPGDSAPIIAFQVAMAWETEELRLDAAVCAKGVRAVLANPALGVFYVAEAGTAVVGVTLVTYEWSDWRNGVVWWLQSVYVLPEFRRQGVYSGIYGFIRGLAQQDAAVRGIRLYVDRRNAAAREVYARLGMNGEHYQVFEWMKPV